MKSKILLFIILNVALFKAIGQPVGWKESLANAAKISAITQDFNQKTEGSSSLKYTFTDDGTVFLMSDTFAVSTGSTYTLKCDYLDNDPAGRINSRIYFFNQRTNIGTSSSQYMSGGRITSANTVKQATWQTITTTGTTPAGAVIAMVVINMNIESSKWAGAATFNADNFIYTEGTGIVNKIMNSGFEGWPVKAGSSLLNWTEDLAVVTKTSTITVDATNKTEGFYSLNYKFTDDGTVFLKSDTFSVVAGTTFTFKAEFYDNDPSSRLNTRIYFFNQKTNIGTSSSQYMSGGRLTSTATEKKASWQTITQTGTTPTGAVLAFVAITMNIPATGWTGSGSYLADNFSYVEGTGVNKIRNPGFEYWTSKAAPTTGKDILTFNLNALNPAVKGVINAGTKTINLDVPFGTNVATLVPTITLSPNAVVSPKSDAAQNFASPVTYTVTAQDGSTSSWTVTVKVAAAGQTILFFEDFENISKIPSTWVLINNDKYIQAAGEERWQDTAWVVTTSSRTELKGTKLAMASSITSNMPLTGRVDDWMILPEILLGSNSTLSWNAMSTTSSGNYPDDYWVLIAPVTANVKPTVGYFEENGVILQKIAPEDWSATVSRPGKGLASRSINLKSAKSTIAPDGWFNKKVWIAFAMTTDLYTNPTTGIPNTSPGGSALAIDNIKVVNDLGTGVKIHELSGIKLYPNPVSGKLQIELSVPEQQSAFISVTDFSGRQVFAVKKVLAPGFNRLNLDLSEIENGMYLVNTLVDGKRNTTKITVQN